MNDHLFKTLPVVIDSDTGPDDGMAIMLAAAHFPERVGYLLSTYGNLTIEATTQNFKTSAFVYGLKLPIHVGAREPMTAGTPYITEKDVPFIKQNPVFPQGDNEVVWDEDPIEALYIYLKENAPVDYIALGPLTNLALLLRRFPDAEKLIRSVVVMGGGIDEANVTPYAEYNIYCDAPAAQAVFQSGLEIHLAALNVCNPTAYSDEELALIAPGSDSLSSCVNAMIEIENEVSRFFGNPTGIIYDAIALAYYIHPEYFETERMGVDVICEGERYGETVRSAARSNVVFIKNPQKEKILQLFSESVQLLLKRGQSDAAPRK